MADTRATLSALWSPLLAVTTISDGRTNGQIAVAGLSGSILPEAPRVLIQLWKANLTPDLVRASGVFAVHLLPSAPDDTLGAALDIVYTLGLSSGRDHDKLARLDWRPGEMTGSPILTQSLTYLEARVTTTLDLGESTLFVADVLGGDRMRDGIPLDWRTARQHIPQEWIDRYEDNQERQRTVARRLRGLE